MTQDANARSAGHTHGSDGGPGGRLDSAPDSALTDLDDVPVAEHVARYEAMHERLQARLAGRSGGASGGGQA